MKEFAIRLVAHAHYTTDSDLYYIIVDGHEDVSMNLCKDGIEGQYERDTWFESLGIDDYDEPYRSMLTDLLGDLTQEQWTTMLALARAVWFLTEHEGIQELPDVTVGNMTLRCYDEAVHVEVQ